VSGRPDAVASALVKISQMAEAVPDDTAEAHPTIAPLFIINPLSGRGMDNLFSTHPSTENRVAAAEKLAREIDVGRFVTSQPRSSGAAPLPGAEAGNPAAWRPVYRADSAFSRSTLPRPQVGRLSNSLIRCYYLPLRSQR
jgi:heat shock protein HtpX